MLVLPNHAFKHFYSTQDVWTAQFLTSDTNEILEMCTSIDQYRTRRVVILQLWLQCLKHFFCNILLLCGINFVSGSNCLYFVACSLPHFTPEKGKGKKKISQGIWPRLANIC